MDKFKMEDAKKVAETIADTDSDYRGNFLCAVADYLDEEYMHGTANLIRDAAHKCGISHLPPEV